MTLVPHSFGHVYKIKQATRHEEANATLIWHQYFTKKKRPDSKNEAGSSVAPPLRAMLAVVPRLALPPLVLLLLLRWLLLLPLLLVPLLAFGCLALSF